MGVKMGVKMEVKLEVKMEVKMEVKIMRSFCGIISDITENGGSTKWFGWGYGRPDRASRRGFDARSLMKKMYVFRLCVYRVASI